jgi:hypothetical protein
METLKIVRWVAPAAFAAASLTLYVRDVEAQIHPYPSYPGGPTLNVGVGVSGGSGSQCLADSNGNLVTGAAIGYNVLGNPICNVAASTQYEPYATAQTACPTVIFEVQSFVLGPIGSNGLPAVYLASTIQTASNGAEGSFGYVGAQGASCSLGTEVYVTNQ